MSKPIQVAIPAVFAAAVFLAFAQSPSPKFEVASIRPVKQCGFNTFAPADGKKSAPPGAIPALDPNRFNTCGTVSMFIVQAYVVASAKGTQANPAARLIPDVPIEGGPAWVRTDNYAIAAKPEGAVSRDVMLGPMFQALLAERFQLKLRRENRDAPAYALTVAKGGPKLRPSKCFPGGIPGALLPAGRTPCPMALPTRRGPILAIDRYALNLDEFTNVLGLDRPVVNRTGIAGVFDYHLEFAPDETTPLFLSRIQNLPDSSANATPPDPAGGPSIFTAIQEQLGLKLEPTRAPREFLVIDSIERPSPD